VIELHCRPGGVVLKKKWGTPETRLRQRFLNNLRLHTCCTEIILHCVSVSNQLLQWTNFCTNFSPKKWWEWGTRPPCRKKWGTPFRRVQAPLHPCCRLGLRDRLPSTPAVAIYYYLLQRGLGGLRWNLCGLEPLRVALTVYIYHRHLLSSR